MREVARQEGVPKQTASFFGRESRGRICRITYLIKKRITELLLLFPHKLVVEHVGVRDDDEEDDKYFV